MKSYNHKEIEIRWQKAWDDAGLFRVDTSAKEEVCYLLTEFPYPSGDLHVGHWHAFAVPDIFARYLRAQGKKVLYPVGFDSFGLPAENAAIKNNLDPKEWTYGNIEKMRTQLQSMGNSFDWSREIATSDPEYYRFTQWIFIKMFELGLAYKKESLVNWDPVDKTVLANEQVLPDGTAERSGAVVEQKMLSQWFFAITKYADRLIDDLDTLDWPQEISTTQKNWIGRKVGATIEFELNIADTIKDVKVFTTRPDTLYGVGFIALSPEKADILIKNGWSAGKYVQEYIKETLSKRSTERERGVGEKTGVLTDIVALNPITKKEIPVYVADYVLGNYGSGVVMGVPAHDERDYEFAKKFDIEIFPVVKNGDNTTLPYVGEGELINSGEHSGLSTQDARKTLTKAAGGEASTTYNLRDWSIGRQRYWGCPIPIVYDPEGMPHAVPEDHLPWILPSDVDFKPTGEAPLARSEELKKRTEKIFGKGWVPEVDTMDTFMDSSWYFLRYLDPNNTKEIIEKEKAEKHMPVDWYFGGSEHTTLHLLYSRFIYKVLYDIGVVKNIEPFKMRTNRGLILGTDGSKMSKSKGNTLNPDEFVSEYGADVVKSYLAFIGPYAVSGNYPWNPRSISGIRKFFDRIWNLKEKVVREESSEKILTELHKTIQKVSFDIENIKFHTALASLMSLVNILEKERSLSDEVYATLVQLVSPFAPHLSEEIWKSLGKNDFVTTHPWPKVDKKYLEQKSATIAIQINGKMRGTIDAPVAISEEDLLFAVRNLENIEAHLKEKDIKKVIYIPKKVINILAT